MEPNFPAHYLLSAWISVEKYPAVLLLSKFLICNNGDLLPYSSDSKNSLETTL
jgi:hypothetical protein